MIVVVMIPMMTTLPIGGRKVVLNMKTTITPRHSVRAYFESKAAHRTVMSNMSYRTAIDRFEGFLGRVALLADMVDATLSCFFEFVDAGELKEVTARNYQRRLLAIARDAAGDGIIDWPMPEWNKRGNAEACTPDPKRIGLLRYFSEVFVVERQSSDSPLTHETIKAYRSAVRAFERFAPAPVVCRNITPDKIDHFRLWLCDRGMNRKKAGNHAFAVAAIAKHCCPERFFSETDDLPAPGQATALVVVLENQYLPERTKITSSLTEDKYRAVFHAFGRFLGHVATLDDLTDKNVGAFMRDLRQNGKSAHTVNGYRSKLTALWNWCARKRIVHEFPTIDKMPAPAALPTAWTEPELNTLTAACEQMPGTVAGIPAGEWWKALHLVAWDTGERAGALLALTWKMLNVESRMLVVPAEFRKGGRKPMFYELKLETIRAVGGIAAPERDLIFSYPKGRSDFYSKYKRLLRLADLPYVPHKSAIQKMRRSFATHIEASGGNATLALAHSARSITEESYIDPTQIKRVPDNKLLFPLQAATA
jgi:integrase